MTSELSGRAVSTRVSRLGCCWVAVAVFPLLIAGCFCPCSSGGSCLKTSPPALDQGNLLSRTCGKGEETGKGSSSELWVACSQEH